MGYKRYGLTDDEIAIVRGRPLTAALPECWICGIVVLVKELPDE
jgi:hypothetical protein